jgi:DNA-binding MarR family transcriptional regulator
MPSDLQHLPPSAKYVYHVLVHADGPLQRSELITITTLSEPTVDRAIEKIQAEGVLDKSVKYDDLRLVYYEINTE